MNQLVLIPNRFTSVIATREFGLIKDGVSSKLVVEIGISVQDGYISNVRFTVADFWEAYEKVIPDSRHRSVGKSSSKTNLIERFNCTLRSLRFRI